MQKDIKQLFRNARACGTPLIAIETPDQNSTVRWVREQTSENRAVLVWDCATGLRSVNARGEQLLKAWFGDKNIRALTIKPMEFLQRCIEIPGLQEKGTDANKKPAKTPLGERVILLMQNAHRWINDDQMGDPQIGAGCSQAVYNLRDVYKMGGALCTLVMLGPAFRLPSELVNDVVVLDEPLPSSEELTALVKRITAAAEVECEDECVERAVLALRGLSAYAAEQVLAMSLAERKLEISDIWDRKRAVINATPGLELYFGGPTFEDVGGLDAIKQFLDRVMTGKRRPSVIVWMDEIQDAMGGGGGGLESSGVGADQHGALLTKMQEAEWAGLIALGVAGAGKSFISKALGATYGVPVIRFDLGAMKGKFVGQSEEQIRGALKIISAMSDDRVFCIASCNSLQGLSPQFKARFSLGTWFFPLPTEAEQEGIWAICEKRFGVTRDRTDFYAGWVGREIYNACKLADSLGAQVSEAAKYIVPVCRSGRSEITALEALADGRFLATSDGFEDGIWTRPTVTPEATASRFTRASQVDPTDF